MDKDCEKLSSSSNGAGEPDAMTWGEYFAELQARMDRLQRALDQITKGYKATMKLLRRELKSVTDPDSRRTILESLELIPRSYQRVASAIKHDLNKLHVERQLAYASVPADMATNQVTE